MGEADSQALAAAEGAANLGWNRVNETGWDSLGLSVLAPCLQFSGVNGATVTALAAINSGTWCPATTVHVPKASAASYQVSTLSNGTRYIIGSATVGAVTRRVKLTTKSSSIGTPLFGIYAVQSEASLDFQNQSVVSGGSVRSDGNITLEDTAVSCHVPNGAITPGPGKTVTTTNGAGTCGNSTTAATSSISWQTISAPSSDNDSYLPSSCPGTSTDSCSGGTISWSPTNKTLTIQNGGTVTLTGNTYTFCTINNQNGTLDIKPTNGKAVQIYMLPPSSCSGAGVAANSQTLTLQNNNSWIKNDTGLSAQGLQVYVLGATTAYLNNSSTYQFNGVIYAPTQTTGTTVQIINSAAVKGAIAAYSTTWTASASLTYDATAATVTGGGGAVLYGQQAYSECTTSTGATPDVGCP